MLPCVPAVGCEYTDGSKYRKPCPSPNNAGDSVDPGAGARMLCWPFTFAYAVVPGVLSRPPSAVIDSGRPDCATKMPLSCQPPMILPRVPSLSHRFFGPHGSSYTAVAT